MTDRRPTGEQTDRQTDRPTNGPTNRQTDRQTCHLFLQGLFGLELHLGHFDLHPAGCVGDEVGHGRLDGQHAVLQHSQSQGEGSYPVVVFVHTNNKQDEPFKHFCQGQGQGHQNEHEYVCRALSTVMRQFECRSLKYCLMSYLHSHKDGSNITPDMNTVTPSYLHSHRDEDHADGSNIRGQ